MLISYIEKNGRNKVKVTLADGSWFGISARDWRAFGSEAGEEIEDRILKKLYQEYMLPKAKLRALNLLKVRDRSHKELFQRLKMDGYPDEVVEQAIQYVDSYHYVDDARFARNYIEYKGRTKSRRELEYELSSKGIDLRALSESDEGLELPEDRETIRHLIRKRWGEIPAPEDKEKQRMTRYLARRGFKGGDSLSVNKDLGI